MYCIKCGTKLEGGTEVCPNCGEPLTPQNKKIEQTSEERVSVLLCIISVIIPIAGLIFFAVWEKEKPRQAKASGICALIAYIVQLFISLILGLGLVFFIIKGDFIPNINYPYGSVSTTSTPDCPGVPTPGISDYPTSDIPDYPTPDIPDDPTPGTPVPPVYNNSEDGVLTFTDYGRAKNTCYDALTDSIIVWNTRHVCVYRRADGVQLYSYDYTINISCMSAYNGILCIGFKGYAKQIAIIDLHTGESRTVVTEIEVAEIAATENMVVFCDGDQWCQIGIIDLSDYTVKYSDFGIYCPKIAINHDEKLLYVVETGLSSCDFIYIDLITLERETKYDDYWYNGEGVYFDGEYVHAFGNTYDAIMGVMVADCGYAEMIYSDSLRLMNTLCRNDNVSFITEYNNRTVVFDNNQNEIICILNLAATEIYHVEGDIYVALCGDSGYIGLIDLSKV